MTATHQPPGWFRFGVFEVDPRRSEVRKRGLPIRLRGRPYDILLMLLERPGEVVTRDELRARLWAADTFVDFDHGVNTAINRLREILGDSAENPRFIETIPRKGYRFIAPVDAMPVREAPVAGSSAASPSAAITPETPTIAPHISQEPPLPAGEPAVSWWRRPAVWWLVPVLIAIIVASVNWPSAWPRTVITTRMRLAVLPFENLSGDTEKEYFSDGFTEELIAELGALEPDRLGVIARTTSMLYKGTRKDVGQIARELEVDYVLEGSVRQSGDKLRITAQLIDARMQTHLWSESYDRNVSDVLGIQSDVAMRIATSLVPTLASRGAITTRATPASFEAYELTLRGRFFREQATEASTRKAIELFERAIALDSSYSPAFAGLGDGYRLLAAPGWEVEAPEGLLKRAKAAAERAIALDPASADARAVMAMVRFTYQWDPAAAEGELREAIRLNPSLSKGHQYYSGVLTTMKRFDEAIEEAHRGMELDPLSATAGTTLGVRLLYAGRVQDAEAEFRKTLEVNPSFAVAHWGLAQCLRARGRMDDHLDELTKAVTLSGNSAYMRAHLAYGYAVSGDRMRADAIRQELRGEAPARYVAPYHLALIAAGLGDIADANTWLERAFQDRSGWMVFLPVQPEFAKMRDTPAFQRLLTSVRPRP